MLLEQTEADITAPLTEDEKTDFGCCESVIKHNLQAFLNAGEALMKINRFRYYRETHKTFADYCADRWKLSRSRAYDLITSAEVSLEVSSMADSKGEPLPAPANERQARELAKVAPERRAEVWETALNTAPEGKVTAKHIAETAAAAIGSDDEDERAAALFATFGPAAEKRVPAAKPEPEPEPDTYKGPVPTSKSNEWYTPARYVEAARAVLGTIDLDPASCEQANKTVKATRYFDEAHDGLYEAWEGSIWLNPPYGTDDAGASNAGRWSARLIEQYRAGVTTSAILCVNSLTFAPWFKQLWDYTLCFTDHRVCYDSPNPDEKQRPMNGTAFVYLGPEPEKFARVFREFGAIVARWPSLEEE